MWFHFIIFRYSKLQLPFVTGSCPAKDQSDAVQSQTLPNSHQELVAINFLLFFSVKPIYDEELTMPHNHVSDFSL